ncbi:MAG TPA: 1,4-alpha-glucan branching protein GlgB [Daejeonella sp.]|nr:1,4-alpha-glucan branching protein GlgB [Daejeonella sp.]
MENAYTLFSDLDIQLFKTGKHYRLYEKLGSHLAQHEGSPGTYFAVWAPHAQSVSLIGSFNGWDKTSILLSTRWNNSGIWEVFVPNIGKGEKYKYHIISATGEEMEKGDPFALFCQEPPLTASIVWDINFEWKDQHWMDIRQQKNALDQPFLIYEMHLGSWARNIESPEEFISYRDMAAKLIPYLKEMNFTHVEFMPVMEHLFYPSWGYQVTGYFAPTARYGIPQDLMFLIDQLHFHEIGVVLDWVPSHFPGDAHGLYRFDGTHLYEHADKRKSFHPDWKSYAFNYGCNEVRSFLISNAFFWLEHYHVEGLRIDSVASMLYLDYLRETGEWSPNQLGGNENLEAIGFLKELNEMVYANFPQVQTIADKPRLFPAVSRPIHAGGLGFGMKWMVDWMNDALRYFSTVPYSRKFHHQLITFSLENVFAENFILPLAHDMVVPGKGSLLNKMPGDEWQKFANLRLLYSYMFTQPGNKMLFMGDEFGQQKEWDPNHSLEWHLLEHAPHQGLQKFVKALNRLYRSQPALYQESFASEGFQWIESGDEESSVFVYSRHGNQPEDDLLVVLNTSPVPWTAFRIGFPAEGSWHIILNSDDVEYWGLSTHVQPIVYIEKIFWQGQEQSALMDLPPLAGLILRRG